jgi:hypothetical protein
MKKIGGLDPFTLVLLVLLLGCGGVLGVEALQRARRPAPPPAVPASVPAAQPAPAAQPSPDPPPAPTNSRIRLNG